MNTNQTIPIAGELMNRSVKCVGSNLSLPDLVAFFLKQDVSCAPVVEDEDEKTLLGFVSQGDALSSLSNQIFGGFPQQPVAVADIMKRHPLAITPETDVFSIASIFQSHGYRHVPVVDEQNRLQGLVSRREVLAALIRYSEQLDLEHTKEHFHPDLHKIMNHRFIISGR